MIKRIADKFQDLLGIDYKVYVDTNANEFIDITNNTTIKDQLTLSENHTDVIVTAQTGTYVALENLKTTSFSFNMEFHLDVTQDYDLDIETFINDVNGKVLTTADGYNFITVLNQPFTALSQTYLNGKQYKVLNLSGSVVISNSSYFGNDLSIKIDSTPIDGLLSASPSIDSQIDPRSVGGITPLVVKDYITSNLSLVIHARKDDTITNTILGYVLDVETQASKKYFTIELTFNGEIYTWNCVMTSANVEASAGGYIVLNVNFMRSVVSNE